MTLTRLLSDTVVQGDVPDVTLTGLVLDSRKVTPGDVYIALPGSAAHGLDFLPQAVSAGAVVILVDASDSRSVPATRLSVVVVFDLVAVTGQLAARFFGYPTRQLTVCGVTGTDGKTSVCRFISEALRSLGRTAGYIGTIGWGIDELESNPLTTPDAITLQQMFATMQREGVDVVALEVSSHALAQGRVNGVEFDVAILTNLGRDHLDYHGDIEHYRAAKEQLFHWPGLRGVVLNVDDELGARLRQMLAGQQGAGTPAIIGYSIDGEIALANDLIACDIISDAAGLGFSLHAEDKIEAIRSPLLGTFNVQNLLACYAALTLLGIDRRDRLQSIAGLTSVPGRMEHFKVDGAASAVVDFAHTPQALEAAILTLRAHCHGELVVVFGCGGDRDAGKRPLMGEVASQLADRVIVTDDNPRTEASASIIEQILKGVIAGSDTRIISDRAQAITAALREAANDDWVLVAGKGHEQYQIVGTTRHAFSDRELVTRVLNDTAGCGGTL